MRFLLELYFRWDFCDFVESHYGQIPNDGGVSTGVPKAELTEGTQIDVMNNLTPIYYSKTSAAWDQGVSVTKKMPEYTSHAPLTATPFWPETGN